MTGFDVTPRTLSSLIRRRSSPLVIRLRRPYAAAAHDDAALGSTFPQRRADGLRVVRIIHRAMVVRPDVDHFAMLVEQERSHRLLQLEAGVVRIDRDAHGGHLVLAICFS